jgi:hypothetical protein
VTEPATDSDATDSAATDSNATGAAETDATSGDETPSSHEPTGVPAADAAARRLADIDDAPVDEHVDIYDDVHRRLQEGLADLDES